MNKEIQFQVTNGIGSKYYAVSKPSASSGLSITYVGQKTPVEVAEWIHNLFLRYEKRTKRKGYNFSGPEYLSDPSYPKTSIKVYRVLDL